MSTLDWLVMIAATMLIVTYGVWKSRGARDIKGYLLSNKDMKWWTIGLSVMATQASAITFLSAPGLGFDDGMRFVQFYFGLPIALIIISAVFIPLYHKLNVFTAYEYLEQRFDLKNQEPGGVSVPYFPKYCFGHDYLCSSDHIVCSAGLGHLPDLYSDWGNCRLLYSSRWHKSRKSDPEIPDGYYPGRDGHCRSHHGT